MGRLKKHSVALLFPLLLVGCTAAVPTEGPFHGEVYYQLESPSGVGTAVWKMHPTNYVIFNRILQYEPALAFEYRASLNDEQFTAVHLASMDSGIDQLVIEGCNSLRVNACNKEFIDIEWLGAPLSVFGTLLIGPDVLKNQPTKVFPGGIGERNLSWREEGNVIRIDPSFDPSSRGAMPAAICNVLDDPVTYDMVKRLITSCAKARDGTSVRFTYLNGGISLPSFPQHMLESTPVLPVQPLQEGLPQGAASINVGGNFSLKELHEVARSSPWAKDHPGKGATLVSLTLERDDHSNTLLHSEAQYFFRLNYVADAAEGRSYVIKAREAKLSEKTIERAVTIEQDEPWKPPTPFMYFSQPESSVSLRDLSGRYADLMGREAVRFSLIYEPYFGYWDFTFYSEKFCVDNACLSPSISVTSKGNMLWARAPSSYLERFISPP